MTRDTCNVSDINGEYSFVVVVGLLSSAVSREEHEERLEVGRERERLALGNDL